MNEDALNFEIKQLKQKVETQNQVINQLRLNLDYLNLLFETLPNPVFYKNKKGIYMGCNSAFEKFMGMTRADIIGNSVYDMAPKEIADKYHEKDLLLLSGQRTQQYEWKIKSRYGRMRDVIFDKAALVNKEGEVEGLIGIITDITKRKQIEEQIRISEEKLKKISSSARDAIIQMDHKGKIVFWNPAAREIFGYTWQEVKEKDLHKLLVPPRHLEAFEAGFRKFNFNGRGAAIDKTLELTALRKDGIEFEVELSLSSFQANGQWSSVGIVRDISDRKAIEREKEQLIKDLEKALSEIKTLKGIVPICAKCKKIRDDKGYWNILETYIQKHSQAEFTHGICPDCTKKLYPDYYRKLKDTEK